jgi:hypothetical protein
LDPNGESVANRVAVGPCLDPDFRYRRITTSAVPTGHETYA